MPNQHNTLAVLIFNDILQVIAFCPKKPFHLHVSVVEVMRPRNVGPEKGAWRCPVVILPECIVGKEYRSILIIVYTHVAYRCHNPDANINKKQWKDNLSKKKSNPFFC